MLRILRPRSGRGSVGRTVTLSAALALTAAACGSDGTTEAALPVGPEPTPPTSEALVETSTGPGGDNIAETTIAPERTNVFPDLNVVRIADRGTVNLADELGGGDLPVLLWFWAPH